MNDNILFTKKDTEEFYIISTFDLTEGFHLAGIKQAYLDFCRTLKKEKNESDSKRAEKRKKVSAWLDEQLQELIKVRCSSQKKFDEKHEKLTEELKKKWGGDFTIGQSQKWINMTLKYWCLLGKDRIPNIDINYTFFHIPIDSIIQNTMFSNFKKHEPWSKFENYSDYFEYQEYYREQRANELCAIVDELRTFNNYFLPKEKN
ncbi:MAG: hypothetical protein CSB01_02190 [Bacteroidia bacterium]|nr:MAG: hypothetical protein CSB01_02190 [Bacteroidia bacterium]